MASRNLFTSGGSEGAAKVRILAKLLQPLIPHRETASTDADADEGRGTDGRRGRKYAKVSDDRPQSSERATERAASI